jgi:hypothetical protein
LLATGFSLVVGAAPQWINSVWGLFSSEPLVPWLLRHNIPHPHLAFSPWWITAPVGAIMFLIVLWIEAKVPFVSEKKRSELIEQRRRILAEDERPTLSRRRFGVRCGTDLYSDNILTGNIPGRYLHAEITVSQSVSACKAYLREIRGGNRGWKGQEQLTFEPSEAPDSLSKALFEKIKYNLDVLLLVSTGDIIVCNHSHMWPRLPRLFDLFAVHGPYDLIIDIGGENAAGETFELRFDWTGNWQTSFLTGAKRLV